METFYYFFLFISGLVAGSFMGALTSRLPKSISILKGRSYCFHCKLPIEWYDNVPLLSYLALGGKCRNCKKKIGIREPIIELTSGISFVLTGVAYQYCTSPLLCSWQNYFGFWGLIVGFVIVFIFLAIAVVDFEHQIIPDGFVFTLFAIGLVMTTMWHNEAVYLNYLIGFGLSSFLLFLNMITKGNGMGLGDVKLAVSGGMLLGFPFGLYWMFLGFFLGAVVGVVFLLLGKVKFGKHIPFGPFLSMSFILILLFSGYFDHIWRVLMR